MNVNLYVIEDYENEPPSGPKKTNPIKPNFKCPQTHHQRSGKKKRCQELFLGLICRKGYNIMFSKRKFPLVPECRSRGSRLAFGNLLPSRVYFGVYPRELPTWPITGGRGLLFSPQPGTVPGPAGPVN